MNKSIYILTLACLFGSTQLKSQPDPDSLLEALQGTVVSDYDEAGLIYFYENLQMEPGEMFTMYEQIFGEDEHNSMDLQRQWSSKASELEYYHYRQYHDDIPVQGAEITEHVDEDGYVVWARGKVAVDLETPEVWMSEEEALAVILEGFPENEFAWENDYWESHLKDITGDEEATYYPDGELLFALDGMGELDYIIPSDRYTLAWKFTLVSLNPHFEKLFYVDAQSGEIFREHSMIVHNGPANIWNHGTQDIDTRPLGTSDYRMWTDDKGNWTDTIKRNIHTKVLNSSSIGIPVFDTLPEVSDSTDVWTAGNYKDAASVHWFATQSWDYFKEIHGRDGPADQGEKVRVQYSPTYTSASYKGEYFTNISLITVGGSTSPAYGRAIDVVAHEYSHGVVKLSNGPVSIFGGPESGALNEGFGDIFGVLIERFAEGNSSPDWSLSEDSNGGLHRSLSDPKGSGSHYEDPNCTWTPGQPDTYKGDFWESNNCDNGGVHAKNGVLNYWFYLLTEGGNGENDNDDVYFVDGVGLEIAEEIVYETLITLHGSSEYDDVKAQSIAYARQEYGSGTPCSPVEIQVEKAWYAVGLVDQPNCAGVSVEEQGITADHLAPKVFPNPAGSHVEVNFHTARERLLEILSPDGKVVSSQVTDTKQNRMDISNLATGMYYLRVKDNYQTHTTKLVKW